MPKRAQHGSAVLHPAWDTLMCMYHGGTAGLCLASAPLSTLLCVFADGPPLAPARLSPPTSHTPTSACLLLPQTMGGTYKDLQAQSSQLLQKPIATCPLPTPFPLTAFSHRPWEAQTAICRCSSCCCCRSRLARSPLSHSPTSAYLLLLQTMGRAYEDMQAQNSRLLQKLTEKDDAHNQVLAERLMVSMWRGELTRKKGQAHNRLPAESCMLWQACGVGKVRVRIRK